MIEIKTTKNIASNRFTCLVYGESGAGKTSLAKTLNPEETLIISCEAGLLSLAGTDIATIEVKNFIEFQEIYEMLESDDIQHKFKTIFLDSLTEIGERCIEMLKSKSEYQEKSKTIAMYGEYSDKMRGFIKAFRDLSHYNVIFTAQSKIDKDDVGRRYVAINIVGGKTQAQIPYFFDEVFYLHVGKDPEDEHVVRRIQTGDDGNINAKDRSGKLELYEPADLNHIIGKILGNNG